MNKYTIIACGCLLLPSVSIADSFDMNPGKWEFTTSTTMPMFSQPQITTNIDCITEEEARQDPMADLVKDGNCKIVNKKKTGNSLNFEMECNQEGMVTRGKGHFTTNKDSASGSMDMTMNMPQMPNMPAGTMSIKTTWKGKRIGSCD